MSDVRTLLVSADMSIRELLERIDRGAQGVALVVDGEGRLVDTVTDGDVRRAILASIDVSLPVERLLETKDRRAMASPLTSPVGTKDAELLRLMTEFSVRHIPLVDDQGRVADIALLSELVKEHDLPLRAVVMAGGFGTRLMPLTEGTPKPMLPVGDRPLLAHIVGQLRAAGIKQLNVTTHYRADAISEHFGNGQDYGMDIRYVREDMPLGTAGALALVEATDQPLLVMNGDILTRVDFGAMLDFHRHHAADMTVGVRQYQFKVPYGVVETDGVMVMGVSEKPTVSNFINAGLYLINPDVQRMVPPACRFDMTELIHLAIARGLRVVCFPIREYWLDIGQMTDYERAQIDVHQEKMTQ